MNRIPATTRTIIPRINPSSAGHDAGTSGYAAKTDPFISVESTLTDRVSTGQSRPTFFCPIDLPEDNSVLPDLELTIPSVSVSSGYNYTYVQDGENPYEEMSLVGNRPTVAVSSGMNNPYQGGMEYEDIDLYYNRPQTSVSSGFSTTVQIDGDIQDDYELLEKLEAPNSVVNGQTDIGFSTLVERTNVDGTVGLNRPNVSVSSGTTTSIRSRNELTARPHFRQKLQPMRVMINTAGAIPTMNKMTPQQKLKEKLGATTGALSF